MDTFVIKRTGRRNRPITVTLASGESLRLNATGTHVRELTEGDVAEVEALPGTKVIRSRAGVAPPPQEPPKKKARKRKKGGIKKRP